MALTTVIDPKAPKPGNIFSQPEYQSPEQQALLSKILGKPAPAKTSVVMPNPVSAPQTNPQQTPDNYANFPINNVGAIQIPQRTTLDQAYQNVQKTGLLPQFKPLNSLDDSYYQKISDQASQRLQKQYFSNPDSVTRHFTNTMNKRGLLGSGIESGGLTDIYKDFGSKMTDFESQLATERQKTDLETAAKNADLERSLAELALGAAGDEARTSTEFDTKMFDSAIKNKNSQQEQLSKTFDILNNAMNNKNIDATTRDFYESLFGQIFGSIPGGVSFTDWQNRQPRR